jgi:hypothetical protein
MGATLSADGAPDMRSAHPTADNGMQQTAPMFTNASFMMVTLGSVERWLERAGGRSAPYATAMPPRE